MLVKHIHIIYTVYITTLIECWVLAVSVTNETMRSNASPLTLPPVIVPDVTTTGSLEVNTTVSVITTVKHIEATNTSSPSIVHQSGHKSETIHPTEHGMSTSHPASDKQSHSASSDPSSIGPVTEAPEGERYSWWKIVVTLVVFCIMAGIILWILKVAETSRCRKNDKSEEDLSVMEDMTSSTEKISRV